MTKESSATHSVISFYCLNSNQKWNYQCSEGSWGIAPNSGSTKNFLVYDPINIPWDSSWVSNTLIHLSSANTRPVTFVRSSMALNRHISCHRPPPSCCVCYSFFFQPPFWGLSLQPFAFLQPGFKSPPAFDFVDSTDYNSHWHSYLILASTWLQTWL